MSENDDFLEIQRQLVNAERAKAMAKAAKLKKDIRSQIARAGWYNPENDPVYEYHEYPKWIDLPELDEKGGHKRMIVQNADEEARFLGVKPKPAKSVSVDITQLQQVEPMRVKRKYTKKVVQPLPPNLD